MTHTPGPWRLLIEGTEDDCIIRTIMGPDPMRPRNLSEVALVTTGSYPDDVEAANARLIAAALELLEALEHALIVIDRLSDEYRAISGRHASYSNGDAKKIEQAIKKARFG